jgi:hypothetical protein
MPDQPPPTVIATINGRITITTFDFALLVTVDTGGVLVYTPDDARKAAAAFIAWADTQSTTAAPREAVAHVTIDAADALREAFASHAYKLQLRPLEYTTDGKLSDRERARINAGLADILRDVGNANGQVRAVAVETSVGIVIAFHSNTGETLNEWGDIYARCRA